MRDEVAAFISSRDGGIPASASDIFLTDGASPAVQMLIRALIREHAAGDAIMTPIPQYPLYSASIALYGGTQVGYYLNESKGWSLELDELRRAINVGHYRCAAPPAFAQPCLCTKVAFPPCGDPIPTVLEPLLHTSSPTQVARGEGKTVRGIAVINPGNPTGNVLSEHSMRDVLTFAAEVSGRSSCAVGVCGTTCREVCRGPDACDTPPGFRRQVLLFDVHARPRFACACRKDLCC